MANDTTLNLGSGGDKLRDYDDGTRKWPVSFLAFGTVSDPGPISAPSVVQGYSSALPVGISYASAQIDPRSIRALTSSDVVSAAQSGTWTVTANAGTGTLAVSAASLPLPSGASTAVKQPALGTAGTASADVLTVQGIASMTALKVDGSAVTQPISGSVTATQATGTNLHTVVDSGTITTVSTVTTVAAVTAISNALPAGTNLLGSVSAAQQVGVIYSGTTALTVKYAKISAATSGSGNTLVAAVTSKKITVLKWDIQVAAAVNVKFQSAATTDLTGLYSLVANQPLTGSFCPVGHFQTVSGEALTLNLSGAIQVSGYLVYIEV